MVVEARELPSRARQIRGGTLALHALLSGHDPVEPDSGPGPAAAGQVNSGPTGDARRPARPVFLAYLAFLVGFACLAWVTPGSSGGRLAASGMSSPGFRSSAGGAGRSRNGPVGPEQGVMRFDARSMAALMVMGFAGAAGAQVPVQWKATAGGNGHWYQGVRAAGPTAWATFQDVANQRGAHLATISGSDENLFVFDVSLKHDTWWASGFGGPYLGARKQANGTFAWVTGESWNYTNWNPGEPGSAAEPNLAFLGTPFPHAPQPKWNDTDDSNLSAMMEWSADCNGDGEVDYGQIRRGQLADFNGNNVPDCCEQGQACVVAAIGTFPVEWKLTEGGNGHWYGSLTSIADWSEGRTAAVAKGGHLLTVSDRTELAFAELTTPLHFYLGAYRLESVPPNDPSDGWRWVTGEPFDPAVRCPGPYPAEERWGSGSSGLGCVGESSSAAPYPYLMEWSADCNNDGVVDFGQILRGELQDADKNGVPDCCTNGSPCRSCVADLDGNGSVDSGDIGVLLLQFNGPGTADLDRDGVVSSGDIGVLLLSFGPCSS